MRPVDKVLDRLQGVHSRNGGGDFMARCPCPGHGKGEGDRNPSLSVKVKDDGTVLLRCFAGCDQESVVGAIGLVMKDLFSGSQSGGDGGVSSAQNAGTVEPCTLANYAEAKRLPVPFLKKLGLSDFTYIGEPAIRMPYRTEDGGEPAVRFRIALEKTDEVDRFKWKKGSKLLPYGVRRLNRARELGYIVVAEGESDCHTLWFQSYPALGIPGANNWKPEWSEHLEGIDRIYVMVEPDAAAERLWERLAATPAIRERLYRVRLKDFKDVSELHLDAPDSPALFAERFDTALSSAVSWVDIAESEEQERTREAYAKCADLAGRENILREFEYDLARNGVAGNASAGKILYLALTSRHLDAKQLVNVIVKGPSSAGKSYTVDKVLDFFPSDAYYMLTAMSEKVLLYSEEPISHRFLVLAEAAGMNNEFQTYLLRCLLSEGKLDYEFVEKTADGLKPRKITREGPTGLIVTTTQTRLHHENETRMFAVRIDDSRGHTRTILKAIAEEDREPVDTDRWHALQVYIAGGGSKARRVTVPYADCLADNIPAVAVRLRRDFGSVLNLIRAHALLHKATRKVDDRGRVVATLDDYGTVRDLIAPTVSEGVEVTVPPVVRETVETIKKLTRETDETFVTIKQVGDERGVGKHAAWYGVHAALDGGYLKNLEDRKGRPAKLVPGDELPEDRDILPTRADLEAAYTGSTVPGFCAEDTPPSPPASHYEDHEDDFGDYLDDLFYESEAGQR